MTEFVSDCPRCGAIRSTHDVFSSVVVATRYKWQQLVEIAGICRTCHRMSVHFVARAGATDVVNKYFGGVNSKNTLISYAGSLNDLVSFERHITLRDRVADAPPEHLPADIATIIQEANSCISAECWNASAAMYRLALDIATKSLLPAEGEPAQRIRRNLGLRLEWLFDNARLNSDLKKLAECVQQDGNDGAHDGTLRKEDAEDLRDFSYELLRRLYTEPTNLRLAQERRDARRSVK